jgi:DNA modification methylase
MKNGLLFSPEVLEASVERIEELDSELEERYAHVAHIDPSLTRQLVSFQANKKRPGHRWYKYKEAFSADLVAALLERFAVAKGRLLDPFAGIGTTMFVASEMGYSADGIELLPIGQEIIANRLIATQAMRPEYIDVLRRWRNDKPWRTAAQQLPISALRITAGAYPLDTEQGIGRYLFQVAREEPLVGRLLRFALLCVLESVSYTRKDGQYLRWDYRSGRKVGAKPFDKGNIAVFDEAITRKLDEFISDLDQTFPSDLFSSVSSKPKEIGLLKGSCLEVLPTLAEASYSGILTSPPYCNRYDYTRTYALELALLGVGENELASLRQQMLSCTVENREKDLHALRGEWADAIRITDDHILLQEIVRYLEGLRAAKTLNNPGIPRMVKSYFYEMACVIWECYRLLSGNGLMIMVNDNVRYAGINIPVDLILSDIAANVGFEIERILVLPQEKGNSSQQMGKHGRTALRKCVYVWRKMN